MNIRTVLLSELFEGVQLHQRPNFKEKTKKLFLKIFNFILKTKRLASKFKGLKVGFQALESLPRKPTWQIRLNQQEFGEKQEIRLKLI